MAAPARPHRPRPLGSLVAAAQRITSQTITRPGLTSEGWQEDAWEMYDLVGEQRFLATTLANRLAQAVFYVGKVADDPMEDPIPVEAGPAAQVLDSFGRHAGGRGQLIARLAVNLFVAGDGWLVGIPVSLLPAKLRTSTAADVATPPGPDTVDTAVPNPALTLDDLEWKMLSVSEVAWEQDQISLLLGEAREDKITVPADDIFMIRVWRPHPRRWWQADSPTRSSLPVLRELVGLTMHISAQVDSRLAGAGILVVPQSAKTAILISMGRDPNTTDEDDPFTEALMEAMLTPIQDRSSASAIVPLVITVPDESVDKFNYITFSTPLDSEARELRDEAIRRLALGQDCPPELLLGVAGMNHWGAWLVREDVVTTHIEPPLALMCDALTTQFLWPVLIEGGMSEEAARQFVIWYDVSHMVLRPNRAQDAFALQAVGAIDDAALREATGFGDADAPPLSDPALNIAIGLVKTTPQLMVDPGLPFLVSELRKVMLQEQVIDTAVDRAVDNPDGEPSAREVTTPDGGDTGTPATAAGDDLEPAIAAGGRANGHADPHARSLPPPPITVGR